MKKRVMQWIPIYCLVFLGIVMLTLLTDRSVTVLAGLAEKRQRHTVIIDAGHGGIDGGATSCTGQLESALNLQIAMKLNDLLQFLGYDTVMVRTEDISIYTQGNTIAAKKVSDLKARVKLANETPNGILVSIHQNYFSQSQYHGAQIFYAQDQDSRKLAEKLQTTFRTTVNPGSKRQPKVAKGVYLMEHIQCTGVLIECGFISNPEEAARISSDIYQKNISCVIASSISSFLS